MALIWRLIVKLSSIKTLISVGLGFAVLFTLLLTYKSISSRPNQTITDLIRGSQAMRELYKHGQIEEVEHVAFKFPLQLNRSEKSIKSSQSSEIKPLDVVIVFTNAEDDWNLREKLNDNIKSLLFYSSAPINFYFIGDEISQTIANKVVAKYAAQFHITSQVVRIDVFSIARGLGEVIRPMQQHFSFKPGAYYNNELFFLSLAIHRVMPLKIDRVVMLDVDLIFKDDIKKLYDHFEKFKSTNLIGLAREQQPVYRHAFWKYRKHHPSTRVGEPPPGGLTGFNSGVVLLRLNRMRESNLYNRLLTRSAVQNLTESFMFKGHLGDQDFFSIVAMRYDELFYILPCSWNRQLCQWWKDKGYETIFDLYHKCDLDIHIYHGNCRTKIYN
ncbi:xyloside xylosyltransferase 1-like [Tubulanus polymorphus]|uniref:xyloside xylosyltransferase 1-like n=1 Tax=Tubulanus polymorphus TaxID=672921 RepID=UPI003DA5A8A6